MDKSSFKLIYATNKNNLADDMLISLEISILEIQIINNALLKSSPL